MSSTNDNMGLRSEVRPAEEHFRALFEAAARVTQYHAQRASHGAGLMPPPAGRGAAQPVQHH